MLKDKYDVTGVRKKNFLAEYMQYMPFTYNKMHW